MNCKGKLIDLTVPRVMGILNITPNSFFDGGKYTTNNEILLHVENMILQGATFIDIGACSTKPNAEIVTEPEEIKRILPVVELLIKHFPDILLSIDTFRSEVARICIENGAAIINDISAGELDDKMMEVVAQNNVPYIMMHTRGTPKNMQSLTHYENLMKEILFYFSKKIQRAKEFGINELIIDPGFGFAKTTEQNYEILQKLDFFKIVEQPILVGLSRKSMIYKPLNTTPNESLNGTTILNTIALMKGAKILRVHDVKQAVECIKLFNYLNL